MATVEPAAPAAETRWVRPRPGRRTALAAILAVAGLGAFAAIVPGSTVLGGGGLSTLAELLGSAVRPDLSPRFLATVASDALVTLAYALTAMTVAIAIGVPGALIASGVAARGRLARHVAAPGVRGGLGLVRAVHELVWALLLVNALGLSPLVGVLAIGIPYGGILGRVLAEHLQDVPDAPLASLRTAGASPWQELLYGRLPLAGPDVVSYLFYRFECAVRSAAVLSFVGLGGLGFRLEVALADLDFAQVWTVVYALVLLVVGVDAAASRVRRRLLGTGGLNPSRAVLAFLGVAATAAWAWVVLQQDTGIAWARATRFVADLFGAGADTPAAADAGAWGEALASAGTTLATSVLAAAAAGLGALVTLLPAAAQPALPGRRVGTRVLRWLARGLHVLTRSVPELVWALLIVLIVRPGPVAAALALAVHNLGVVGRLGSSLAEDLDPAPLVALRSAGGRRGQLLAYGVIPSVLPQLMTFLLYRWEVIIRTTAVVGFVAASGLGYDLRLDLSFFRYDEVGLLLVVYIGLVWLVDLTSSGLRRLAA